MNGDMPHVPITTLAGIAGLTDLLNQLPLPSPLPGTSTKSLLYSGRVAEEVGHLMGCRDETLVSQLASGLSQVSMEHIELKDSLGSDELEGDVPVLLQLLLSRNPNIFRNKTAPSTPQYPAQAGVSQQSMAPPYKIIHGSMQGSPASANYQASMSHSPSGRFVPGQSGSGGRFLPQQSSPVPSPYAPQSPATGYRQYPHPPAYSQHQHLQQGSVASPMIPGGMRNVHENKDQMRAGFTSHILQSSPPYTPPCDGAQEMHLGSPDKQRSLNPNEGERDPADKAAVYDIVGSPTKDPTKLNLRQSRARPAEVEFGGMYPGSDPEGELVEALAAIERMESEAAMETDRGAKEVQDKDKPLKKRKQDSHPQEPGAAGTAGSGSGAPGGGGGANAGHRLAPQEASAASTSASASRPDLQVSLEQAGRVEDTCMGMPIPASEAQRWPQEPQEGVTPKALKHKHDHAPEHRHQPDTPRQKHRPEGRHGDVGMQCAAQSGSKPAELPPYMLGENTSSGVLKNFTIPKIRKNLGAGDIPEGWKQPCVRLERLEPEVDVKKTVKPVVVLQKLSIDEVQRLMRERDSRGSKSGKNRLSSGRSGKGGIDPSVLKDLPPELLAEIESTMPLCERVKMNKRKRSTVNERPKYAEDSSEDEDFSSRKRQKKDRDRMWEFEDRDRRNSGEHRRGSYDTRRGSGSRYDDSDQDSPPPSLSDVARRLKMREKQKRRKAYEPKLTPEELMDSSTFKRFLLSIDNILENLEDVDFNGQDDDEIPQELLLGKQQLNELGSESAKIKAMGITCRIPSDKLVKLLNILEKNILDGSSLSTHMNHDNDGEDEERLWRDLIMERVTKSGDACLTALNIMTSSHMPKAVYIEDVIERVLQYTKFHLQNTLYPQYDPVYRIDPKGGETKKGCTLQVNKIILNKFFDITNKNGGKKITVFSRYEKHRQLILEEIFTSLARLPTSKRSLRNFRLNSSDAEGEPIFIQMVSALVLQLIQCVVHLPSEKDSEDDHKKVDDDVFITNSYETARRTAQNFLSVFLKKCGSKQGEEDYRPLFENFVQDLLSTVNKPDWPASELLLSLLGRLLVHQFSNKQTEMALRVASLDYLGTVAARLRKDAVTSRMDQKAINRIIGESSEGDETQRLQKALLGYMDENAETDPALTFARKFYIAQWFRDCTTESEKAMRNQNQKEEDSEGTQHAKELQATGDIMQRAETRKKFLHTVIKSTPNQFTTLRMNSDTVDYEDACLIVRYLASTRPFSQSFDIYLTQILRVLGESAIAVRTKAMKCLSEVVAVDPSILARSDMQRGVHGRLMDNSTSVREAAVELLGRFVLSRPQLTEQYYDMLIERILDTGISVRKRVIKILRDICLEQPNFSKITEMCVKMIRRVNDEEGIKKLVNETFQKLWFTPTASHDKETMNRKILNITDVVAACKDTGYDWFEQLLQNLLKSEEDSSYKPARKACVQLVDNLVEYILKYEEAIAVQYLRLFCHLVAIYCIRLFSLMVFLFSSQSDFMVICNVAKILELVVPLMDHPSESFLTTIEEDLMKLILKYGMTVVQYCVSCLGAIVNKVTHNYKFVWACFNRYYGALTKLKLQHQEGTNSMALAATKAALLRSLFTVGALCRHFDFDFEQFKGTTKVVIKEKVLESLLYFTNHEDEEVRCKAIIGLGFLFIMHPSQMFIPEVKSLYNGLLSDKRCSITLKIQVLKNLQMYLQEEDSRMQEADREWQKMSKQEDLKEMGDISSGMSSSIMQLYLKQVLESFFHTQSSVRHFALNVIALTLSQGLIHPVQCVPYLIAMGTDPEPTMRNICTLNSGMKMSYQVQQAVMGSAEPVIRGFRQDESNSAQCSHLYSMVRANRQHRRAFLISLLNLFDDSSKIEVNMLLFIADNLAYFPYQSQEEPLFIMHHIDITLSVSGSNLLQTFKESLVKVPGRKSRKKRRRRRRRQHHHHQQQQHQQQQNGSEEERGEQNEERERNSGDEEYDDNDYEENEEGQRVRKPKPTEGARQSESDSDSDLEDADAVMERLPDDTTSLLDFARASQGILLLLVLKQHLKNLYGFSDSKIQKYSPTESAKVYDKAVNRKSSVYFSPRQTIDFLQNDEVHDEMTYELKRKIVKQYLDFKLLMEHLDPDEEDEEGETSANVRNKAITALLGGAATSPRNHHTVDSEYEDSDGEERTPGASRRGRRAADSADLMLTNMNESVSVLDIIAIHCPKYRDRPQIARVIQRNSDGYSIHWMAGSYSSSWTEAKRRDGRKLVPWLDTIRETDIIYKKITLTSGNKLNHKVAQTLRSLYAAKDRNSS
uniref:Nipped-B protein n=1 Tax=Sinocyclocheilus anshuiensis TaxID=1608454 RepID=A0A671PY36_9TELE